LAGTRHGTGWHGPVPYLASRTGNQVFVDCEGMAGHVLVAPTFGLRHSGEAITGMSVVAEPITGRMTRLQITLPGAAHGTLTIAYGATGTIRPVSPTGATCGTTGQRQAAPARSCATTPFHSDLRSHDARH